MDKALFTQLVNSLQEMVEIEEGHRTPAPEHVHRHPLPDVKAIRKNAGMKQAEFANTIGLSVDLVRSWEQQRRFPSGIALKMLRLLEQQPDIINTLKTIHA